MITPSSRGALQIQLLLLMVLAILCMPLAAASDWSAPEAQLVSKIIGVTGPGAAALQITNRSNLSQADVENISRSLRSELAALGLQFVDADQASVAIQISLSEDLQNYVWIAEIRQGAGEPSVVMVSAPRRGNAPASSDETSVIIHKALLWSQAERILDVAVMDGNPTHMAVLDSNQVTLYRLAGGHWQPEQSLPITHTHAWPRDLRGRLVLRKDHLLDAYLPGVFCRSTNTPLALHCYESDDPWPLGTNSLNLSGFFTPSRNYFTGALAPGIGKQTSAPPFYSAAALPREQYTLWLFAGVDGQAHLLDGMTEQMAKGPGWGSDIASVHSPCGTGWNVLASSRGDGPTDSLRAFSVPDREPLAVSQASEFPGPITALWTETSGNFAIAVSHNLETGNYEAFRLSFICGE